MLEACERIVNSLAELKDKDSMKNAYSIIAENYDQAASCLPQILYHFADIRPRECSFIADICIAIEENNQTFSRLFNNRTISVKNGERLQYYLYKKGYFTLNQLMDMSENKPELQEIIYLINTSDENEYVIENIFPQNTLGDCILKENIDGIIANLSEEFKKPLFGARYLSGSTWLNIAAYFGCAKSYFLLVENMNIDNTVIEDAAFGGNMEILQDIINRFTFTGNVINKLLICKSLILSHHELLEVYQVEQEKMFEPAIRGHNYSIFKNLLKNKKPQYDYIAIVMDSDCLPFLTSIYALNYATQEDLINSSVLYLADSVFDELLKYADNSMLLLLKRFVYENKSYAMFDFIVRHGIEITINDLNFAAAYSAPTVVRQIMKLLNVGPNCQRYGITPLMAAAMAGNYLVVKDLVRIGASTAILDGNLATPMGLALRDGHIQTARYLAIVSDPNSTIGDADMSTPLMASIIFGQRDLTNYFVQRGANIAAQSNQGMSPIILALRMQDRSTLDMLLERRVLMPNEEIERLPKLPTKPLAPLSDLSMIRLD